MKPVKKTTKNPEREKPISKKKRVPRPWKLEYMIVDEEYRKKHNWFYVKKEMNIWYESSWEKYLSVDHALKELNKITRSYFGNQKQDCRTHWMFAGQDFRLVNNETNEIVYLQVGEKEIYVKEN